MWLWTLFCRAKHCKWNWMTRPTKEDEPEELTSKQKGYVLEYDAARKKSLKGWVPILNR